MRTKILWLVSIIWVAASCGMDDDLYLEDSLGKAELKPEAIAKCKVKVAGKWLDMETEYLPKVIACENDAADWEAMLANMIAARTYAYYIQYDERKNGQLSDTISDQKFNCTNPVTETIRRAIRATAGKVITKKGNLIAGFYVLGANSVGTGAPDPCKGKGSSGSEKYVTYNEGKSGTAVQKSSIGGSVAANQGCLSQKSAQCLSLAETEHLDILKYFYGKDIALGHAQCQPEEEPQIPLREGEGISLSCEGCDLSTHDCVHYLNEGYRCLLRNELCTDVGGTTKRQCDCTGWEYCTSKGEWSGECSQDVPTGFFQCIIPEDPPANLLSKSCDENCNLSTHDCVYRIGKDEEPTGYTCVEKSDECELDGNEMAYRQCDCSGYQFCKANYDRAIIIRTSSWSTECLDSKGIFECAE